MSEQENDATLTCPLKWQGKFYTMHLTFPLRTFRDVSWIAFALYMMATDYQFTVPVDEIDIDGLDVDVDGVLHIHNTWCCVKGHINGQYFQTEPLKFSVLFSQLPGVLKQN